MNHVILEPNNRTANPHKTSMVNNFLVPVTNVIAAILRTLAGSPMSERDRFRHSVYEARVRTNEELASTWIRPH